MANFQIGHALPDDDEDDEGNIHLHSSEICKIILDTNVPQKCFPTLHNFGIQKPTCYTLFFPNKCICTGLCHSVTPLSKAFIRRSPNEKRKKKLLQGFLLYSKSIVNHFARTFHKE